jgi:glyoxylase-like metal-dependent hydrolase (beta-lactamase superfamily II)
MADTFTPSVASRAFGHGRASVIHTARIHFFPAFPAGEEWVTEDTVTDEEGRAVLGVNSLLVEAGPETILVDPAWWPAHETKLGPEADLEVGPPIDRSLASIGVGPADVTRVLITHGHPDHFNALLVDGALRFPNAEHLFPLADWEQWVVRGDGYAVDEIRSLLRPVERAGKLRLVDGDLVVGGGVTLLHTPGESDGHQVVRFEAGGERLYYLGDLFHLPVELRQLDWAPVPGRDAVVLQESRLRVLRDAAAAPSTLLFTHGAFPAWGTAAKTGPDSWAWRYL